MSAPRTILTNLSILARHDVDLTQAAGHTSSYWKQIRWLGADGREVGVTEFDFGPADDAWHEDTIRTKAPDRATIAVLRIGFDSPNLYDGRQPGRRGRGLAQR